VISYGNGRLNHTPFYSFPEDTYACEAAIQDLNAGGRTGPGDALAALGEAVVSAWEHHPDAAWHKPIIVVFAGDTDATATVPADLLDSLEAAWQVNKSLDDSRKRMIIFAPDRQPWTYIANNFEGCLFFTDPVGRLNIKSVLRAVAIDI
jgi:hypothetical protein